MVKINKIKAEGKTHNKPILPPGKTLRKLAQGYAPSGKACWRLATPPEKKERCTKAMDLVPTTGKPERLMQ